MRILCISAHGPVRAGKVAFDLHHSFNNSGYRSRLLTIYDNSGADEVISMFEPWQWKIKIWIKKVKRKIFKRWIVEENKRNKTDSKYQFFEHDVSLEYFSSKQILKRLNGYKPDIIVVFFTTQFVSVKNIKELALETNATVLWQFLDMAPLTGGCHYAWECNGYKDTCGNCPALFSNEGNDLSAINLAFKKEHIEGYDLRLMIGSKWDEINTRSSSLFRDTRMYRTFMSVNADIFNPRNKSSAREKLSINHDEIVIFFGSVHFGETRKGMSYLLDALHLVSKRLNRIESSKEVSLLIAGSVNDFPLEKLSFKYRTLGYLKEVNELANAYAVADMFVCPSIYDSGPVMINQSLMAGTPVVAFEMGVALDLVINGETGYCAKLQDTNDLAEGILRLINMTTQEMQSMSNRCRGLAERLYHPNEIIKTYTSIFRELEINKKASNN